MCVFASRRAGRAGRAGGERLRLFCLLLNGLGYVFDDKQLLAVFDQAKLTTRDFLDRVRIFTEASGLLAQHRVFRLLPRNRGGQLIVFVSRPQHGQQAAIANEAIYDNDGRNKQEQELDDAPIPGRLLVR